MEPNKEAIKTWVGALRSSKYKQGIGNLANLPENGAGFCCLGVLCELAITAGIRIAKKADGPVCYSYDGSTCFLPYKVQEWVGLGPDPFVDGPQTTCSTLNDGMRFSFAKIADKLEETYLGV